MGQHCEIVSIQRAQPPPSATGSIWHRYVIAFVGSNTIHGCRQGSLNIVTMEVEKIIGQLNNRHRNTRG